MDCPKNISRLWDRRFLETGGVRDRRESTAQPFDWSVQVIVCLSFSDTSSDFRSEASTLHCFMGNDYLAGLFYRPGDCLFVQGNKGAKVEYLGFDPFGRQRFSGFESFSNH